MWENTIQTSQRQSAAKSIIKVVGKFPFTQTQAIATDFYPSIKIQSEMGLYCPELEAKPVDYQPVGKKIYAEGQLIGVIDEYDNLWLISDMFPTHVNVSSMLFRRVRSLYLSENQCILSHRRNPILLNWGAKKILEVGDCQVLKMNQRSNKHVINYFTAFSLQNLNKDDRFYYSNAKKVDNSNKLYQLKTQGKNDEEKGRALKKGKSERRKEKKPTIGSEQSAYSIVAYPTQQVFPMKNKVVGISVGKFHCMCWDSFGLLYTWGNRSLALGYEQLPREKITTTPKLVRRLNKFVTMGFAGTHYSLALTSEGKIYEWGIKKEENQFNEELIFEPQILKLDENQSRVIILKGKEDLFVCLNSRHELFIWGERAAKYLHPQTQIQYQFKNGHIYQPFLIPHLQNDNIIDFGIGEYFIALLISNQHIMASDEEKQYWSGMLKKVKSKLKFPNTVKTEADTVRDQICSPNRKSQFQAFELQPLQLIENSAQFLSHIDKSYEQRNLKKQYFRSLKNQDKFYLNLMRSNRENANLRKENSTQMLRFRENEGTRFIYSQRGKNHPKMSFSDSNNKNNMKQSILEKIDVLKKKSSIYENKQLGSLKKSTNLFLKTVQQQAKNSRVRLQNSIGRKRMGGEVRKPNIQPYKVRLERVQERKKSLQQYFCEQISKKVEENSIEFRNLRHQQILEAKIHEKNRNLLKHTLQSYLIKHYLVKMITFPIEEARKVKILQFAKSLHLSRIEKNLRTIFVKARVKHRLRKLKKFNFFIYALLCHIFKKYVKKRRQQKSRSMRKLIAQELYKNILREKIRFGFSKTHLNTRKLQKFREWLVMSKIERLRCLRILWKNHLLSILKVTNDTDAITLCKTQQNCTFESLYKEKVSANPMLKLETFLNKSPIFELRSQYFQSIIFLFRKDNKVKSEKILKSIKSSRKKPKIIKFIGQNDFVAAGNQNSSSSDLLPYSLHYNLVVRPKSMEINIPESMKKNENWVKQEVAVFQRCLNQILETHQKNYLKARRKYDIDLAYFIREKYESLAEKRWKYIIEYNQIKSTPYKTKREKELYRIFDLIGMRKILNQDCLPEKYLMLDEAIKKRDAPVWPSSSVVFGLSEFKEAFKKYYEVISSKAKHLRKTFV